MPNESEVTLANYHIIGGAKLAAELDAKRAIRDGAELASTPISLMRHPFL